MTHHDVIVIGAGFAGMYQLVRLRRAGFDTRVIEAGSDVGGTWFWNRYPGARCDIESIEYSYSFDQDLEQEWDWSERYAAQAEILSYARHVADRYDLREDIEFNRRVRSAEWDESTTRWTVTTDDGQVRTARYVIAATGCLSMPSRPRFDGVEDFAGDLYWTSSWPHEPVDLRGKRVGVIGTGSSGLQTITAVAPDVSSLVVFQRTPVFAAPAHNGPNEKLAEVRKSYPEYRAISRMERPGFQCHDGTEPLPTVDPAEVQRRLGLRWDVGGLCFTSEFPDVLTDAATNEVVSEYVRGRIRDVVDDPEIAELLSPRSYPIATKRMCVDTGYYQVFNQDNVTLVDIAAQPIERVTDRGVITGGSEHELDVIIFATGFDAMTGALNAIDIRNGDRTLREKWSDGPLTYMGLMSVGFPNLFTVTGPQSPSVLSNMLTSIEYHVDWITTALERMRDENRTRIEPEQDAEDNWVTACNDIADLTLLPQANSWYMGANIPGKRRTFLPFAGGVGMYKQIGDGVAVAGYHGFERV